MGAVYMDKPLIGKDQFIGLDRCTWLYSGAETPVLRGVQQAVIEYLNHKSLGPIGREKNVEVEYRCKQNLAKMMGGKTEEIALLANSSEAISTIARSLNLRRGDNVIIHDLEFPSGVLPWLALKKEGIEVRIVHHQQWKIEIDDILCQMDERTRLVFTSHVSYLSGARLDIKTLYQEIIKTQAFLFVDSTQSLGVVPVNIAHSDFIVSSSYKWLLSLHGLGILAVNSNRAAELVPKSVGWRSIEDLFSSNRFDSFQFKGNANKFELGYPSYSTIYSMEYSTGLLLNSGITQIEEHILDLGGYLINELKKLGYEVMTPSKGSERAGNISIKIDCAEQMVEWLLKHQIYVWGGDGRIRASIHLFNDRMDVKRFVDVLAAGRCKPTPVFEKYKKTT
jgi:cysteine desulfurase/selenocysteine lyase